MTVSARLQKVAPVGAMYTTLELLALANTVIVPDGNDLANYEPVGFKRLKYKSSA